MNRMARSEAVVNVQGRVDAEVAKAALCKAHGRLMEHLWRDEDDMEMALSILRSMIERCDDATVEDLYTPGGAGRSEGVDPTQEVTERIETAVIAAWQFTTNMTPTVDLRRGFVGHLNANGIALLDKRQVAQIMAVAEKVVQPLLAASKVQLKQLGLVD